MLVDHDIGGVHKGNFQQSNEKYSVSFQKLKVKTI